MRVRPQVSWLAVRYINPCIDEGRPTLEEIIEQAYVLGLRHLEIYAGMLRKWDDPEYLSHIDAVLRRNEIGVCQITCAPDFTHPDPAIREREFLAMRRWVQVAHVLGATGLRVTAGCLHEGVAREDGITWAVDNLARLADFAESLGVKLGFENHYRDRRWTRHDFAHRTEEYLAIFERLRDTAVGVNFDTSNQLMTGRDPLEVLEVVKHKVWHVHASDRRRGEYTHTVIGEGAVDFDAIFTCLAAIGYTGYISIEDGQLEGDEGTLRSLQFVRRKIIEHWK
ncbi:MAG: sugar phosphate isomerase/epimerase family protein [Candidatus Zipacnadales bacterium]